MKAQRPTKRIGKHVHLGRSPSSTTPQRLLGPLFHTLLSISPRHSSGIIALITLNTSSKAELPYQPSQKLLQPVQAHPAQIQRYPSQTLSDVAQGGGV